MKFIMDLSTFSSQHSGGKDEVAYNLLKDVIEKDIQSVIDLGELFHSLFV